MALIPILTPAINQAGDTITLTDSTGAYDATTNIGGYGTPNRSYTDAVSIQTITDIIVTKPDGTTITLTNQLALTNPTQAAIPTLVPYTALIKTLSPVTIDYAATVLLFPDGIYKFTYKTWYRLASTAIINGTARTNIYKASGTTYTSIVNGFGDTRWVRCINSSGISEDRYVASIYDAANLIVSEAFTLANFPNTTVVSVYAGYITESYLKVINGLLTCFQPKIAKTSIAEKPCCKTCKSSDIDKYRDIFYGLFAIDAQFKVGLYDEANANIATLNKICTSTNCDC